KYKSLKIEFKKLQHQKSEAVKEFDYNLFLLKELEEANLISGEMELLEDEYETLNNIEEISERLAASHELFNSQEIGVIPHLTEAKNQLSKLANFSERYKSVFDRITSALIELDDVFAVIEELQESLETDPNRLNTVDLKLQVLYNLMKKHTATDIDELIQIKKSLSDKVSITENLDSVIAEKELELATLE